MRRFILGRFLFLFLMIFDRSGHRPKVSRGPGRPAALVRSGESTERIGAAFRHQLLSIAIVKSIVKETFDLFFVCFFSLEETSDDAFFFFLFCMKMFCPPLWQTFIKEMPTTEDVPVFLFFASVRI